MFIGRDEIAFREDADSAAASRVHVLDELQHDLVADGDCCIEDSTKFKLLVYIPSTKTKTIKTTKTEANLQHDRVRLLHQARGKLPDGIDIVTGVFR